MSPLLLRRLSDEKLGARLASGDAAAFDELYRRYANRLAAYGGHLLGDAAAGDDVAQVALLNAYQAVRAGRVPDSMRAWLYRIAHNAALDLLARRRELLRPDVLDGAAESPSDGREIRGALLGALARLPERQRRAWVLREVNGLRVAEIAAELSLAVPQVEQALFAARNRLAEQLLFGERLSCEVVTRLGEGVLGAHERRAIKAHLRTCSSCRAAVGSKVSGVARFLPLPSAEWVRDVATALVGGGAPAGALKVGAVVATASVAAGVPLADVKRAPDPPAASRAVAHSARLHEVARADVVPEPPRAAHAAARPVAPVRAGVKRPEPRPEDRRASEEDVRAEDRAAEPEREGATSGHGGPGPSPSVAPSIQSGGDNRGPSPVVSESSGPDASDAPAVAAEVSGSSGSSGTSGGPGESGGGSGSSGSDSSGPGSAATGSGGRSGSGSSGSGSGKAD